jgi:hypothetical protein
VDYLESKEDAKELKDAPEGQEELYKRLRTTLAEFNAMNRKDPVFRLFEFYGEREESLGWAYLKAEEYEYKKKYGHETNEERRRRQSLERQARDLEDARRAFLVKLYEKKKRYIDFVTGKILLRINGPCKHNQNAAIHGFPAGCALHREGACPFIHRDQKKFWQDLHKIPEKMWEKETKAYSKKVSELRAHARDVVRSLEFCGRRVDGPRLEHPDHVVVKPTGVPESVVREHRERYAQQRRVQEQSYLTAPGQGRRARARHNTAARRAFHTSELDVDEMHEAAAAVAAHEHGTRR